MKRLFKKTKNALRQVRHRAIRNRILGTAEKPRLSVFRSLRSITAQLIDDQKGVTLCYVAGSEIKEKKADKADKKEGKLGKSYLLGKLLAEKASAKKIIEVVFDRGGYKYHGRVKALAEGAREGGLKF